MAQVVASPGYRVYTVYISNPLILMKNDPTAWLLEELGRLNDDADRLLEAWLVTDDERLGRRLDAVVARRMQIMKELG